MERNTLAVYVILDPMAAFGHQLADIARWATEGGATLLQLRADQLSTLVQLDLAEQLVEIAHKSGVPFVVNDRVDVALAVGADGVHVGHPGVEDMPPDRARRLLGEDAIIGVSVATPEEARQAELLGASYLSVGPIFTTLSKGDAGPAVGAARLIAVKAASALPVVGIGGITLANAGIVIAAGSDGVAVISTVSGAADPQEAVRRLRRTVSSVAGAILP